MRNDLFLGLFRKAHKTGGVEHFGQIRYVNQVMRNFATFLGARFGRADVHAAINLHGID